MIDMKASYALRRILLAILRLNLPSTLWMSLHEAPFKKQGLELDTVRTLRKEDALREDGKYNLLLPDVLPSAEPL